MVRFNEKNEIIKEEEYRAILVGIQLDEDISYSMKELAGLAQAAGVTVLGEVVQSLPRPNPATLIGSGKVAELAQLCANMEADTIIFNEELSGMQLRTLEETLSVRVIAKAYGIWEVLVPSGRRNWHQGAGRKAVGNGSTPHFQENGRYS